MIVTEMIELSYGGKCMYSYILYGSTVSSDIQFPQLVKRVEYENEPSDIVIQAGMIPDDIKQQEGVCHYHIGEKRSWLVNSTTWLVIEDGSKVTYELRPKGNVNHLRTYILGFAMAMLYLQQGEMAIHCAAVSKEGEAILIAGESGSGKSTVTDTLLSIGYHLMADDMAVVRINQSGRAVVVPGFPYQKLCRDVITRKGCSTDDLIYIHEDKDKFLVPYKDEFYLEEKPLKAMFLLVLDPDVHEVMKEQLKGFDKFHALVDNLFLRHLLNSKKYEAKIGQICLQIASNVPIYLLRRPIGTNTLSELLTVIESITE
jgi:energy-coupling factor transporter ATP-binding protein EcfA2